MTSAISGLLLIAGYVAGAAVWLITTISLIMLGETGLAALAFFFPPADIILSFMVDTTLGLIGVGSIAAIAVAAALSKEGV